MSSAAETLAAPAARPVLDRKSSPGTRLIFLALLVVGIGYSGYSLVSDISGVDTRAPAPILPYFLLGVALLIALGFEFVNGFHDTANAVATVIYTHSLPPHVAVVYSGTLNFLGVLLSSGAVAFGIISLLPV
ncbi:MAG TPA: inorganic phosphate transporter, partial [Steroidobacteraceae bacterium]|nr:inorganic phosphate transporter [Steroidobacteraceae bacterium]